VIKLLLRNSKEKIIYGLIISSALITMGILFWIFIFIVMNGMPHLNLQFIFSNYSGEETGIFPMIINTLMMIGITIIIAVPIGISTAIYLVEYAKNGRVVNVIRFSVELLAGIPSIIYGLFGMVFFVTILNFNWSILSGTLTLSIMILPTIIRTTEEALISVPKEYREGSLSLGASKIRTIMKVVLPSAQSGILTGIILGMGRISGETAAIYLTAGMVPRIARGILESGRTLSVHMYLLAKEGISFEEAYATATILLLLTLILNIMAKILSRNQES
jgi:phosphate transport system permease protein